MNSRAQASVVSRDWADSFLAGGWKAHGHATLGTGGRHDWVVLELTAGAEPESIAYRLLHAPAFMSFAERELHDQIVEGIRAFPAERLAFFESALKPGYVAQEFGDGLLAELTPKLEPLDPASFKWPVLVMSRNASGSLTLLGSPVTANICFDRLVDNAGRALDDGNALLILLTCRAQPPRMPGRQLTLTQPFHQRRFAQVNAKARANGAGLRYGERRDELLRTLHRHLPGAVDSLRLNPVAAGKDTIGVLRSRLAESASDELLGRPGRRVALSPRVRWAMRFASLTPEQRDQLRQVLSPAEQEEVDALVAKRISARCASTRRVLRARAHAKLSRLLDNGNMIDA